MGCQPPQQPVGSPTDFRARQDRLQQRPTSGQIQSSVLSAVAASPRPAAPPSRPSQNRRLKLSTIKGALQKAALSGQSVMNMPTR